MMGNIVFIGMRYSDTSSNSTFILVYYCTFSSCLGVTILMDTISEKPKLLYVSVQLTGPTICKFLK